MKNGNLHTRGLSVFLLGFVLVLLLPMILATFDITFGRRVPFFTRLELWNRPWNFVAGLAIFLTFADFRRQKLFRLKICRWDFAIIIGLVALSVILSRTVSADSPSADLHLLRLMLAVFLGLSAYYSMAIYRHIFSSLIYRMLLMSALGVLALVLVFIYISPESRLIGKAISWLVPGFGPVRVFGVFIEIAIAVSIGLIVTAKATTRTGFLWLTAILCWAAIFWSGGRGAVVSLVLSTGISSLLLRANALQIWAVFLATAGAGALLSLLLWVPEGAPFGLVYMFESLFRGGADAISAGRLQRWLATIDLIREQPAFGYGLNQFSNLWHDFARRDEVFGAGNAQSLFFITYRHVHNIVLEAFLSWGLVGGGLFLYLLLKTWVRAAKRVLCGPPAEKIPAFFALNVLLIHANLTGIYIFPHSLYLLAIFFGILLAPNYTQNENTNG